MDIRSIERQSTGVGQCTWQLSQHLPEVGPQHTWRMIGSRIPTTMHPLADIWLHGYASLEIARWKADIAFAPAYYTPMFSGGAMRVTFLHDMAVFRLPESFPTRFTAYFQHVIRSAVRHAVHFVVNSQFTRNELLELFPAVSPDQVTVIPLGTTLCAAEDSPTNLSMLDNFLQERPFFLHIGTVEPRKNVLRLIQAFLRWRHSRPEYRLILAGKLGEYGREIQRIYREESDRIVFLDYLDPSELKLLQRRCHGLVIPSYYEGFGIPVLDAIALNTPMALSRIPAFEEIDRGRSILFDPHVERDIEEALEHLAILGSASRNGHRVSSVTHPDREEILSHYTWRRAAETLVTSFEDLVASS